MKKGFTLVELLAVIMILGLVSLLVIPTVTKTIRNTKEKLYQNQVRMIEISAKKWAIENINELSETEKVYLNLNDLLNEGYIEKMELRDPRNTKQVLNGCILIEYEELYNNYNYNYFEETCSEIRPLYVDNTGASIPELTIGMIPVIYNGTNWVKANLYQKWYDYSLKEWANAVTVTSTTRSTHLNAAVGTVIPMSDINTMWVWIPRYKYAIPTGTGARSINVAFESKTATKSTGNAIDTNYLTHPAFTFGTTEVNGIWVGKFETTGTIGSPTILPNTTSIRTQTVKAMYDSSRAMENNETYGFDTDGNIHMAKNSEWGSIVYLSHSQYGKNSEPFINPSSTYITGRSGVTVSQASTTDTSGTAASTLYSYDGKQCSTKIGDECTGVTQSVYGMASSTTGNIYGIYDMSGGTDENVMGMYRPIDTTSVTDNSGFGATTSDGTLPSSEYWDRYTTSTTSTACSGGMCYGNALSETFNWYDDFTYFFVGSSDPWLNRGFNCTSGASAGIFSFLDVNGSASSNDTFRVIQMKL